MRQCATKSASEQAYFASNGVLVNLVTPFGRPDKEGGQASSKRERESGRVGERGAG